MSRENGNDLSVSGVASVDRALAVLTAFKRGDKALSLAELTRRTGLVKTTVLRLAISLEQRGLLKRLDDGGYRLDAEVLRLAAVYQDQLDLEALISPILKTTRGHDAGDSVLLYPKRRAADVLVPRGLSPPPPAACSSGRPASHGRIRHCPGTARFR